MAREGRVFSYRRQAEPPASFWTAVATGVPGPDHGVASLDSFRPLGVRTPLARSGPLRGWWSRVEVPLGLAEYRPLLANRRRAFTLWELASRGGEPALAVNWWATYPAEAIPGLVVAHGAYQLLRDGAEGAVAPPADRAAVIGARSPAAGRRRRRGSSRGSPRRCPAAAAARCWTAPCSRTASTARSSPAGWPRTPRAAALYLPGLDIAADGWHGGDVAFADLVRAELRRDRPAARPRLWPAWGRWRWCSIRAGGGEGGEGRMILWRRGGCAGAPGGRARSAPEAVAAALLRALGLPQSAELPLPPRGAAGPPPPVVVAGYGAPRRGAAGRPGGRGIPGEPAVAGLSVTWSLAAGPPRPGDASLEGPTGLEDRAWTEVVRSWVVYAPNAGVLFGPARDAHPKEGDPYVQAYRSGPARRRGGAGARGDC